MSRWLRLTLAISIGFALGACSDNVVVTTTALSTTTAPPTTTSVPTTKTAAPTTTTAAPPTTTTIASDPEIPYPDNRGDDWLRIVTELNDFVQWLDENPDPELVRIAYAPDTPLYEAMVDRYAEWVASDIRDAPGDVTETVSAELLLHSEASGTAILDVVDQSSASVRVDGEGNVVDEIEALPLALVRRTLYWDDEYGWRFADGTFIQELDTQ